jgi:membrane-associated phospholipid phosphatase
MSEIDTTHSEKYRLSWARLVSDVLSPPIVWTLIAFPLGLLGTVSIANALASATLYSFLSSWVPVLFIVWMVRRGHITDIHMKVRKQRRIPLLVTIIMSFIGWQCVRLLGASPALVSFTFYTSIGITLMSVVTLYWQISLHAMAITSATTIILLFFGMRYALALVPLIPLVSLARLNLHRHTPLQILAGASVGILIPLGLHLLGQ